MKKMIAVALTVIISITSFVGCSSGSSKEGITSKADYKYPATGVLNSVVAYSAGGTSDNLVRQISVLMAEKLACNSNVTNVTGGSASIAGKQVHDSSGDGTTALGVLLPALGSWRTLGYAEDITWTDFYAFPAVKSPFVLAVSKNSKFKNMDDLAKYTDEIKWGNAGIGSAIHLSGQMVIDAMGFKATAVPYSGGREAATSTMAGEVDFVWASIGDLKDLLVSGDLVGLGSVSEKEIEIKNAAGEVYKIPSLYEAYPEASENAATLGIYGMALPRNTPPEAVSAFKEAFLYAVGTEEFKEFVDSLGMEPFTVTDIESDELMAKCESVYAWTIYEQGLAGDGIIPSKLGIPKIEDFKFQDYDLKEVNTWP